MSAYTFYCRYLFKQQKDEIEHNLTN